MQAPYAGNEATFNSYRTHVERLLLGSLLVAENHCWPCGAAMPKPLVKSRFLRIDGRLKSRDDIYEVHPAWRPFSQTAPKREANPFRAIKQKGAYKQPNTQEVAGRALTHLQCDYVIETAEALAEEDLVPGRRIVDSGEVQT